MTLLHAILQRMQDEPDPESEYAAMRQSVRSCSCLLFGGILLLFVVVTVVHWATTAH